MATISDDAARKVAADIAEHGVGYVRIDRDGRAEHVPMAAPRQERSGRLFPHHPKPCQCMSCSMDRAIGRSA